MDERESFWRKAYKIFSNISVVITILLIFFVVSNFGNFGQTIQIMTLLKTKAIQPVTTGKMIEGANAGIVSSLNDPYSTYFSPEVFESFNKNISGTYSGVGLLVTMEKDNKLLIVSPFKGTPAHKAGLLSGDWIVKINDLDTSKLSLEEAANKMLGEPGTEVNLTVFREGSAGLKEYKMTRENIQVPSVEGTMLKENKDIAYISLTQFNEHTGQELLKVLKDLQQQKFKGIILDLRDNPGGLLTAALEVAARFIPKGPIVHIEEKNRSESFEAPGNNLKYPLVVLVNKGSASASEIVSGAIKDTKSGVIVGETTFGKGLVQTVFPLSNKAGVKITTARYLTPNKTDINKKGIKPDYEVELSDELKRDLISTSPDENKDPQLKKAIEVLRGQIK